MVPNAVTICQNAIQSLNGSTATSSAVVIYNANFNAGVVTEPWKAKFAFEDTDFYIIIFAGFAAYIVWGFILTYVIDEYDNIVPARVEIKKTEVEIKHLLEQADIIKESFSKKIALLQGVIKEIETEIENIQKQIQNNK